MELYMALTPDDRREMREVVKDGMKEAFGEQGIDFARHAEDHKFLEEMKGNMDYAKKVTIKTGVTAFVLGVLGILYTVLFVKGG